MVNNQNEFNKEYNKKVKEIELEYEDFQGQLVIEDYSELEGLELREIEKIDKLILKNLEKLRECTVWDCSMKELVIENCPKLEKLNVRKNLLTSLEFLKSLENLEELEINGNTELNKILEPYEGNWKVYRENLQKLVSSGKNLTKENFQELLRLQGENKKLKEDLEISQRKYNNLKKFLEETLVSLSQDAKQEVVSKLEKEIKEKGNLSYSGGTRELMSSAKEVMESVKDIKNELETDLAKAETKIQELEKQLVEAKVRAEEREKEIKDLSKSEIVSQNPIYKEAINFLRVKSIFLNARRETIEELKNRYNELDKFINGKNAKFTIAGDAISNVGEAASSATPFGLIPKALGEIIKAGNEFSKIKFVAKNSDEFQILLKNENELVELDNTYDSLIGISDINILNLKDRQVYGTEHLFNSDCEISAILGSEIWAGRTLNSEDMKKAISSLNENLKGLEKEFNQQFNEFKSKLKLGKEYIDFFIKEKKIRIEIQKLRNDLKELVVSSKSKLESKKWFAEEREKRNKERELLLQKFLNNQPYITVSEKELLERKVGNEELNKLRQVQIALDNSKKKLATLQEKQQPQIQIPPK